VPAAAEPAPAKVNLTLRIIGRRPDGYHELESLVAFALFGDRLTFTPGPQLTLTVHGPTAPQAGAVVDNLVLTAAQALAQSMQGLKLGRFKLAKRLPVAAGLGGGSADAAAALRLLARANGIASDDARIMEAARVTGADVPVCLDPRPRIMRGIGEVLSDPFKLGHLPAVLVNPGVAVRTADVFRALGAPALGPDRAASGQTESSLLARLQRLAELKPAELFRALATEGNDLEPPAIGLQPAIAAVLAALRGCRGCVLARMSGSGATCFGLFDSPRSASATARRLRAEQPGWWVRATALG